MQSKPLSRFWLILGGSALAVAGLYSLVLVIARTPQLASLPFFQKFFHEALVVHVDLSVLVWFLAIICMLWSITSQKIRLWVPYTEEAAQICFALAIAAITLSPFDPKAEAMMSNYIPVIHSPIFFLGLAFLFCGMVLMLVRLALVSRNASEFEAPIHFALRSAGFITLVSAIAFYWSYRQMPAVIDGQQYYDMLFWGGGHLLQFTHVQILMICWMLLARALKPEFYVYPRHLYLLFAIGPVCAIAGLVAYPLYSVESAQHRQFFTHLMILVNGIAPTIFALWILPGVITFRGMRHGEKRALWSTLFMSLLLFIYGGILGALIEGQNVVIPAHYHGSIVGITLAFMGAAYLYLPTFGYRDVASWKLAYWQPIVYGIGQIMHISGLAYSGGYGVLRKTPGEIANVSLPVKTALGFMGLGGLIAIIGGLMFVIVLYRAIKR
jgi:cytochrome c oxidase subunit 1